MTGPLLLSIESSCDETGIALIDGGRCILSNVVASQVALHAATGGIVPEVAARAHLRWIVPTLDEAWADAGVSLERHRRGRGHVRARARGLAARRDQLREGPRLGPRQAAHRRQPPRGARLRGVAGRSGRGRGHEAAARVPARRARRVGRPHVPRRDARSPDVPAARRDRRRRRGRGVRQGRAAARAWAIRAGRRSSARRRARAPGRRVPARLDGRFVRLQLLGAQDGGTAGRSPRLACGRALRTTADAVGATLSGRHDRGARLGLPGIGRRRSRHQGRSGRTRDRRSLDRARRGRGGECRPPRSARATRRRPSACR